MILPYFVSQIYGLLPGTLFGVRMGGWDLFARSRPKDIALVSFFIKNLTCSRFLTLTDIAAYDRPDKQNRFAIVYNFLSTKYQSRFFVRVEVPEGLAVPSLVPCFSSANWFEREVWDLLGVRFYGHPDMRRILTDYGFDGHPLRRDFPMTGYVEARYDSARSRVVYEPVELAQEYRDFSFSSP